MTARHESNEMQIEPKAFKLSRPFLIRSFWQFRLKTQGWIAILFICVLLFLLLVYRQAEQFYYGPLIAAIAFISFAIQSLSALTKTLGAAERTVTFSADENSFHIQTDASSASAPWSSLKRVRKFDSFWVFYYSRSQLLFIPTEVFSEQELSFLSSTIRKHKIAFS